MRTTANAWGWSEGVTLRTMLDIEGHTHEELELIQSLHERYRQYVFFHGADSCFSQWFPAPFEVRGLVYGQAEQWMMAEKARIFGDEATRSAIMNAQHPKEHRNFGRAVSNFDDATWKQQRLQVVIEGNVGKFTQNPALLMALKETQGCLLVEASPTDCIWGIGLGLHDPKRWNPQNWRGGNLLGAVLTHIRETTLAAPRR